MSLSAVCAILGIALVVTFVVYKMFRKNPPDKVRLKEFVIGVFLASFAFYAHAQTVARSTTVSLVAPTQYTDGTALTGATTYNVYNGVAGGTFTKIASGVSPVACPAGVTPPAGGVCLVAQPFVAAKPCFSLTAVNVNESDPSNSSCVKIPSGPGGIQVTVIVTVS